MSGFIALIDLLKAHDFGRMECSDHDGRCCPEGGCHDLRVSQYEHNVAVVAEWLTSEETVRAAEDRHPDPLGSCCLNAGQVGHRCPPLVSSTSMAQALAHVARQE